MLKFASSYRPLIITNSANHVTQPPQVSKIGVVGLAVMGQNLALNIADKKIPVSVYNRTPDKTDLTVERAKQENLENLTGFNDMKSFVESLESPRAVVMLIKAGKPVDSTIERLCDYLEPGDMIIDGGNEWYENTERRGRAFRRKRVVVHGYGHLRW